MPKGRALALAFNAAVKQQQQSVREYHLVAKPAPGECGCRVLPALAGQNTDAES